MRKLHRALPVLIVMLCSAAAEAQKQQVLPLRTVRLYETGIGYFERSGVVDGGSTTLPVPAGHLDDALKTLVVIGQKGQAPRDVQVHGLEFQSSLSRGMARALSGLPQDSSTPITYEDLLASLKGAEVEVLTERGTVRGRIAELQEIELPPQESKEGGKPAGKEPARKPLKELTVLLLTDRAEIRRLRVSQVLSVPPIEQSSVKRLSAALDALSSRGAQTRRMVRLLASSKGPLAMGYISEAPLYRITYRLVLDGGAKGTALLQGWALIHNDADEDWRAVRVQLSSGRPDSFLFPLAAPRYQQRELIHPQNELSTVPQLLDTTVDALWGDHLGAGGMGLSGTGMGGGGSGSGSIGLGSMGTIGHGSGAAGSSQVSASSLLSVGNLAGIAQQPGVESGVLFTYTLPSPVDLRAHGSALLPFLMQGVEAETMTWFSAPAEDGRAAVRFTNSTRQTLPEGPISFFEGGGFAGEAVLPRLKPRERRFLQYGTDLDTSITVKQSQSREETRRLTYKSGQLVEHFLRHAETLYVIENRSGLPRKAMLSLTVDANAKVTGCDAMDYDSVSRQPLALFEVKGQSRQERRVKSVEGLRRSEALASLTARRLAALAKLGELPQEDRAAVHAALSAQQALEQRQADLTRIKGETGKVERDISRLRDHLKLLSAGRGHEPFVSRLLLLEDQLRTLEQQREAAEKELPSRREAVGVALSKLQRG